MSSSQTATAARVEQSWRRSLDGVDRAVCTSCGADARAAMCPVCGRPVGLGPEAADVGLGDVHVHKRRLHRPQRVVRLSWGRPAGSFLAPGGRVVELADEEVTPPVEGPPEPAPPWSVAGGLAAWIASVRAGRSGEQLSEQALVTAAYTATAADLFQARRLGQDLVTLGLVDLVHGLALPASERAWLALVGAARWGDEALAAWALGALPAEGYRPKTKLLAWLWPRVRSAAVVAQMGRHLTPFAYEDPVARALLVVLDGEAPPAPTAAALVDAVSGVLGLEGRLGDDERAATVKRIRGYAVADPGSRVGPADRLLEALDPCAPAVALAAADAVGLRLSLLDDLVDLGRLPTSVITERDEGEQAYLTARLDPSPLDDASVERLAFHDERARRALIRGDAKALDGCDGPFAAHARALLAIRSNRRESADLDAVAPEDRQLAAELVALLDAAARGDDPSAWVTPAIAWDRSVWEVVQQAAGPEGLRPNADLAARYPAFAEWSSLAAARELLFVGQWRAAADSARSCLALATGEAVRDEALNLLACAYFQLGDDSAAIAALEQAIAGEYSAALLANIGVVAARFEPELAARHLAKLVAEAPTVELKLAAAQRIVAMWSVNDTTAWEGSDAAADFPDVVRAPVRAVFLARIPLEDFQRLGMLLARRDAAWLATADLRGSPHARTLEARFCVAKAKGIGDLLDVMASVDAAAPAPAWFDRELAALGDDLVAAVVQDIVEDRTDHRGLAEVALELSDRVRRLEPLLDAQLVFAASALLLACFWEADIAASDLMATRLARGRATFAGLEPKAKEGLEPMLELAHRRLALNYAVHSVTAIDRVIDEVNALADRLRRMPDQATYLRKVAACRTTVEECVAWRSRIAALLPYVDDGDPKQILLDRVEELRRIEAEARSLA